MQKGLSPSATPPSLIELGLEVNAWYGLSGMVGAAETVDSFKMELDRYLEALGIEGYRKIGSTGRLMRC